MMLHAHQLQLVHGHIRTCHDVTQLAKHAQSCALALQVQHRT